MWGHSLKSRSPMTWFASQITKSQKSKNTVSWTYIKLFEKLGNMEGMDFFVGWWLEDVIEFLFFVFSFDVVEEGVKVTFEGYDLEDEKCFEVVEQDAGFIGQPDG